MNGGNTGLCLDDPCHLLMTKMASVCGSQCSLRGIVNSGFLFLVYYETQHSDLTEAHARYIGQNTGAMLELGLALADTRAEQSFSLAFLFPYLRQEARPTGPQQN